MDPSGGEVGLWGAGKKAKRDEGKKCKRESRGSALRGGSEAAVATNYTSQRHAGEETASSSALGPRPSLSLLSLSPSLSLCLSVSVNEWRTYAHI